MAKELNTKSTILYGDVPPVMQDIVDLVLAYDKVYDYEGSLQSLTTEAKILAQHFSGHKLGFEDIKGWNFANTFLMIESISAYHGFDLRKANVLDPRLVQRTFWLDEARSSRKADCERFIRIIDSYLYLLLRNAPAVAEKLTHALFELPRLFEEGIIISRQSLLPEIKRARGATFDMAWDATERDMQDEAFLSLVSWVSNKQNQWWTSFFLNALLLQSSYLGIPLHLWDPDLPLVKYKYQRGARYLPGLRKTDVIREAFSVLIPEVYTVDVSDLLQVRNSSEFKGFRREVNKVYTEVLETPDSLPDADSLTKYLRSEYFSQLERLALERRPKPGTVLLKKLISGLHPIVGLVMEGTEIYEEYRDKYKTWKFAVSTLEMKEKLRTFTKRRQTSAIPRQKPD